MGTQGQHCVGECGRETRNKKAQDEYAPSTCSVCKKGGGRAVGGVREAYTWAVYALPIESSVQPGRRPMLRV